VFVLSDTLRALGFEFLNCTLELEVLFLVPQVLTLKLIVRLLDLSTGIIGHIEDSLNSCNLLVELLFSGGSHIDLGLELDHLNLLVGSFLVSSAHLLLLLHVLSILSVTLFVDEHLNSGVDVVLKVTLEFGK
jgi:hypothetical protein